MILNGALAYLTKHVCYLILDFFMCVCLNNPISNRPYRYLTDYNCRWFILFCIFDTAIRMSLRYKFHCILQHLARQNLCIFPPQIVSHMLSFEVN